MLRHPVRPGFSPLRSVAFAAACTWAAACSLNDQALIIDVRPQQPDAGTPVVSQLPPLAPRLDASVPLDPEPPPPDERPLGGCSAGATRPCGPSTEAGNCALGTRRCVDGAWGDCTGAVYPAARICGASDDKDCNGLSDDTPDAVCECSPGAVEPCDTHPGLDGVGSCRAGQRACEVSADGRSSRWGACTGSVGPAEADSCSIRGDDANCDARPNGGCTCIEGEVVPCGANDLGICRRGMSTCVNSVFSECQGAVLPRSRDCASEADNDCDGLADDTIDEVCSCAVGTSEPCDTHPEDGVGICRPGTRTCVAGEDGASSRFGACTGAVGPAARRCNSSADNDCNGVADDTVDSVCACVIGAVEPCEQHIGLDDIGRCHAGQQLCVAGPNNTTAAFAACSGSVGPAAADSCAIAGDDADCDGTPNGGCECVAGDDEPCAANPAASSCSAAGRCVACAADADCRLVSGLPACNAGTCVRCTASTHCPTGQTCNATTHLCEAPPPPVTEEPEEPTPIDTPAPTTPVTPVTAR